MPDTFYDTTYYTTPSPTDATRRRQLARSTQREQAFYRSLACPRSGETLLDVGCGTGDFLQTLQDTGASLWGIDISTLATEIAKRCVGQPEHILCASADPLPFPDHHFDYVTAWGVVEHFPNPVTILQEMRRVAKPTGQVVIMVPNVYYYGFIWRTLRQGTGPTKHQQIEHLHAYKEWAQMVESSGLTIVSTTRHNKFNKPWLQAIRSRLIPFYLSNHFIYVCRK